MYIYIHMFFFLTTEMGWWSLVTNMSGGWNHRSVFVACALRACLYLVTRPVHTDKIHGDQGTQLILTVCWECILCIILLLDPGRYLKNVVVWRFAPIGNYATLAVKYIILYILYIYMEIWWNMVGCLMLLAISCFNVETVRELDFYPVRGGNGIVPARQLLLSDADIVVTEEKKALLEERRRQVRHKCADDDYTDLHVLFRVV